MEETQIKELQESIAILNQVLLELQHARLNGPGWYTKGEDGMYEQTGMWLQKGFKAIDKAREVMSSE